MALRVHARDPGMQKYADRLETALAAAEKVEETTCSKSE